MKNLNFYIDLFIDRYRIQKLLTSILMKISKKIYFCLIKKVFLFYEKKIIKIPLYGLCRLQVSWKKFRK